MAKIYVSSTFLDLQEYREQVRIALRSVGHEDIAMEYYTAGEKRPLDKCLDDVAACDVYVGIFAWRYGYIPKGQKRSVTEQEYRTAMMLRKPCLIFLLKEDAAWPVNRIEVKQINKITKLRKELSDKHQVGMFSDKSDLAKQVTAAIYNWALEYGHIPTTVTLFPQLDLDAYFEALRTRYGVLALEGLTPPQREEYLQLQLQSVFVEQNVRENPPPPELPKEVLDLLRRKKELHQEDLPKSVDSKDAEDIQVYYNKPTRPVLDVMTDPRYKHIIILGDPGSGKSTLARYIILSLIERSFTTVLPRPFYEGTGKAAIPLLIELRSYAGLYTERDCETFLEFLEYLGKTEGWRLTRNALHNHLKNDGHAVVIFDGLDEIFDPEQRERITRQIVGFARDYPKVRIIVTSRIIGYRRKILTDAGFIHFTLQDLDEKQVEQFVTRWYDLAMGANPNEAKERRERILKSFKESASIHQLAGNAMLLTIMAIIGKHQELPRERWKLYDHAASVLIQHWDVNKHLKDRRIEADFIGEDDKKELLRRLAFRMQGGESGLTGNYIHREQLQAEFENYLKERYTQTNDRAVTIARAMIDQFRERNFILCLYGANLYGFVHRAFLEYFSATAFVYQFEKTRELTLEGLKFELYGIHWQDRNWHEVLRLICGIIDEKWAGEIIDYLINDIYRPWPKSFAKTLPWNIALAIQCFGEVRNINVISTAATNLLHNLCLLFDQFVATGDSALYGFIQSQILPTLHVIGTTWPGREIMVSWLKKSFPFHIQEYTAEFIGKFVGLVGGGLDDLYRILLEYANHKTLCNRVLACYALLEGWKTDAHIMHPFLLHPASRIRILAINKLVENCPNDAQTLPLLHKHAVNDPDATVRETAILAIVQYYRDDPQTLPFLRERAIEDNSGYLILVLVQNYQHDAQTLQTLRDWILKSESSEVRQPWRKSFHHEHFTDYLREQVQSSPILSENALGTYRQDLRQAAILALVQYYRDDPQTLSFLHERAVKDANPSVRETAILAIVRYYQDDPQTLPFLRERAIEDNTEYVRLAASSTLALHYRADSRTLHFLRDWILKSGSDKLRRLTSQIGSPLVFPKISEHALDVGSTALETFFRDDKETLLFLRKRAVNDMNAVMRQAAILALVQYYRDDPQTLSFLHERAVKDANPSVRETAILAIVRYYQDDPQTLSFLHGRAANDANSDVRKRALIVASYWAHPDTLPFLQARAQMDSNPGLRELAMRLITKIESQHDSEGGGSGGHY